MPLNEKAGAPPEATGCAPGRGLFEQLSLWLVTPRSGMLFPARGVGEEVPFCRSML
jgi:hypothetical protein